MSEDTILCRAGTSGVNIVGVSPSRLGVSLAVLVAAWLGPGGQPAQAAVLRVSVQPVEGTVGSLLRQQIVRLVRGHGFRVVTSIPRVGGTGQYLSLARDHRLAAFVTGELEDHKTRQTLTILVWDGANGSVVGRWSASGPSRQLSKALARGFWKHLGPALAKAQAPQSSQPLPHAPPMRIDAGAAN